MQFFLKFVVILATLSLTTGSAPDGTACSDGSTCASGHCDMSTMMCGSSSGGGGGAPDGTACSDSTQCASGWCNEDTMKCAHMTQSGSMGPGPSDSGIPAECANDADLQKVMSWAGTEVTSEMMAQLTPACLTAMMAQGSMGPGPSDSGIDSTSSGYPDGTACSDSTQCASGWCNEGTMMCGSTSTSCHNVMNANSWTCDAGKQMRHETDYHNPYSMGNSESAIKGECCRDTCHNVMNANSWTCDAGKQMRHEYDFHNPYDHGDSESAIKGECCLETCHSVMNDKTLTCDSDLVTRDIYDYHKPSGGWEQTDDIIKHECCREPPAPPQCLAACLAPCGMPIEGDDLTPWCECFNNACYAPPGALDSCPTYGEDDDPSKDEIIEHVYDKPEGFQCTKPDFPPGTGVPNEGGPPPCIAHCFDQAPGEDYCPSDCDTSGCTENSIPPKSWIDTYFANNCSVCITGENCDFSNGCPTSCDYSACTASTVPTYDEAAYYFANGCVKPSGLQCGNGMFLKNKNTDHEWCKPCQAGKFSPSRTKRNRRCKKCGIDKYQKEEGSTSCITCPTGFNTKGQRGKKQCFDAITGESMKQLGMLPYPFGWKNE